MTEKPAKNFTFRKSARLSRKKHIKELFEEGSSFFIFPFKVLYREDPQHLLPSNQVLISVPKKFNKSAVKRNKIKRLIREAYRLNQHILSEASDKKYFIAYIYVSGDILQYKEVENKLNKVLIRLKNIALGRNSRKPDKI